MFTDAENREGSEWRRRWLYTCDVQHRHRHVTFAGQLGSGRWHSCYVSTTINSNLRSIYICTYSLYAMMSVTDEPYRMKPCIYLCRL